MDDDLQGGISTGCAEKLVAREGEAIPHVDLPRRRENLTGLTPQLFRLRQRGRALTSTPRIAWHLNPAPDGRFRSFPSATSLLDAANLKLASPGSYEINIVCKN